MSRWLHGLNSEQGKAVLHTRGPLLILAGAGSGKTTVLVARTGRLLDERFVKASEMCVLTFTNKAARELKSRVASKLGSAAKGLWAGTFHSFGLGLLREYYKEARLSEEFGVLDQSDCSSIVKELVKDFINCGKVAYDAEKLLGIMGAWRERGQTEAVRDDEYEQAVEWILPRYLKRLELLGMVDFDSLILKPFELMKENPKVREKIQSTFQQVMVDEFQDTNQMQMRLIRLLVEPHHNLTVVGDDDQSIYGWRGACISNILDFPKTYQTCKVVRLEMNYRSSPAILDIANAVIAKNEKRHAKILRSREDSDRGETPEIFVYDTENEEAEGVATEIAEFIRQGHAKRDIAVLYRSNSQGALLEAELRRQAIPYLMSGGTAFFDRKETRDILAYLRCAFKPNEVSFRRILNTPARGIGDRTIEHLAELAQTKDIGFIQAAERWREAGVDMSIGDSIETFFTFLHNFIPSVLDGAGGKTSGERMLQIFAEIGYRAHVDKSAPNAMIAGKKWKLVELFAGIMDRYLEKGGKTPAMIKKFVDAMELRDTLDAKEENEDRVQLLTLHACKGLEFPVVFMMGLEEDIIPHKTLGSDISEERRLFYVGVTRAQKRLIMSRAEKRRKYGKLIDAAPSRFVIEIPPTLVKEIRGSRPIREDQRKSMIADLFRKLDTLGAKPANAAAATPK